MASDYSSHAAAWAARFGWSPEKNRRSGTQHRVGGSGTKKVSAEQYRMQRGFLYGIAESRNNARRAGRPGFTTDAQAQKQENRILAERMQDLVVQNIQGNLKRPRVSTGRLVEATAHPDNIRYGFDFWGVGIPEHLDTSQAKYWRTIEEGTARAWKRRFTGTPLPGYWGNQITGMYENRWGTVARGGGRITRAGQSRGGKFIPVRLDRIDAFAGRVGEKWPRVGKEIAPMNAYLKAWHQLGGAKVLLEHMTWMRTTGVRPGTQYVGRITNGTRRL